MFGKKSIDTTINTKPANPFEDMKRAIHAATSAAEKGGVPIVAIRNFIDGLALMWRQRADFATDQQNRMTPEVIAAEAARHRRAEQRLQVEREEYREAVNRAADREDERWHR
jgi:hypothetical protein